MGYKGFDIVATTRASGKVDKKYVHPQVTLRTMLAVDEYVQKMGRGVAARAAKRQKQRIQ
jgi:hypothetical protein